MTTARPSEFLRTAFVDAAAIEHNTRVMRELLGVPHLYAVVKANAYGHDALIASRAALAGGADALAVADIDEALDLRAAGITAPILCWIHARDADFAAAVHAGLDIGVSRPDQLETLAAAVTSGEAPSPAVVQFKVETGLSRNGLAPADWQATFERARQLQEAGIIEVRGVFSHLSNTSIEDDQAAAERFRQALDIVAAAGISPAHIHLASSGPAASHPELRFNAARLGIALYGLSPSHELNAAEIGLRPAMTLQAEVVAVRQAPVGTGVSYDYTYRTPKDTSLALLGIGYADGLPRELSGTDTEVVIRGQRYPIVGRVAMDQVIVDLGAPDTDITPGDQAVLFGDPSAGVPGADDWARASHTINYEIVSRIGPRVRRVEVRD